MMTDVLSAASPFYHKALRAYLEMDSVRLSSKCASIRLEETPLYASSMLKGLPCICLARLYPISMMLVLSYIMVEPPVQPSLLILRSNTSTAQTYPLSDCRRKRVQSVSGL